MYGIGKVRADAEIDKKCFLAWQSEGTLDRAKEKLLRDNVTSSHGTNFSRDGVRKAAVRYQVNNYAESKKYIIEEYKKHGYIVSEFHVDKYMIKMAVSAYRNPYRIKCWMEDNHLMDNPELVLYLSSLIAIPND